MTKTRIAIGAALAAGFLATLLVIQQQSLATARAEQSELQARLRDLPAQTVQPARQVPGTIDIAARDRADLERLRVEAAALRARIAEFSAQARQLAAASPAHKPEGIPLGDVLRLRSARVAGQATPEAAIQTFLCAMFQGDTNRIAQLLVVDPGADGQHVQKPLQEVLEEFASESAKMRNDDKADELEVHLLEEQPGENNDRWVLMDMDTMQSNGRSRTMRILLRPTDTGWGWALGTNGEPVEEVLPDQ